MTARDEPRVPPVLQELDRKVTSISSKKVEAQKPTILQLLEPITSTESKKDREHFQI
jgi:hypothetical protein